jgi:hypothetical protein
VSTVLLAPRIVVFLKMSVIEQRAIIKFCVLLHRSPSEPLRMPEEAYGKASMKKTRLYECRKHFRDGRASVIDDPRWG